MKLLEIKGFQGYFLAEDGTFAPLDKITKDDLLRLVNFVLLEDETCFDEFSEEKLKNQAHQIIYKSIHDKLSTLSNRKAEFKDETGRLFLKEYGRYSTESS